MAPSQAAAGTLAALRTGARVRLSAVVIALSGCSDAPPRVSSTAQAVTESPWVIVTSGDFNGDGFFDLVWNDQTTNRMTVSLLWGTHLLEGGPEIPGPPGEGWKVVAAEDFDYDGMADVAWFSPDRARATVWCVRGTHVSKRGPDIPAPGAGWNLIYAGDFGAKGGADLLWHHGARRHQAVGRMIGVVPSEVGRALPAPGDTWMVPSTGDFNFDGTFDTLWYDTATHRISVWLMRGTEVLEAGPEIAPPSPDAIAVTAEDFNADGMTDVIWNDPTRNLIAVWLMRGVHLAEAGPWIPGPPGDGWFLGTAGDADGDGMADAIWRNARTNRFMVWTMRGTVVAVRGPELPGPP
jgi:hypothetical protein